MADGLPLVNPDCPTCPTPGSVAIPGPTGAAGAAGTNGTDGANAFTTVSVAFVMPAEGATVTATVANGSWATVGQVVYVQTAGHMQVTAKAAASLTLQNLENTASSLYTGNAAPGTNIPLNSTISPAGPQGAAGADGTSPVTTGSGTPEGSVSGSAGDLRVRTDQPRLYFKHDGPDTSGWVALAREFGVDIRTTGGVGDGSTDNSSAFSAAQTASNLIYIPEGTWRFTSALTLGANDIIVGAGPSTKIFIDSATENGIELASRSEVHNLYLYAASGGSSGAGLKVVNCTLAKAYNVEVNDNSVGGFLTGCHVRAESATECKLNSFYGCNLNGYRVGGTNGTGYLVDDDASAVANHNHLHSCLVAGRGNTTTGGVGYHIKSGTCNNAYGLTIGSDTADCVKFEGADPVHYIGGLACAITAVTAATTGLTVDTTDSVTVMGLSTNAEVDTDYTISGGSANYVILTEAGDLVFDHGTVDSQTVLEEAYAGLYQAAGTTQTITTGGTYEKLTAFDTAMAASRNATASVANDQITVTNAGVYEVNAKLSVTGTVNKTLQLRIVAGTGAVTIANAVPGAWGQEYIDSAQVHMISAQGLVSLNAGDVVEVWGTSSSNSDNFNVERGSLLVRRVG